METRTRPPARGAQRRASAHHRLIDSLIIAGEACACRWCRVLLWALRWHVELDIPAWYPKGAAR